MYPPAVQHRYVRKLDLGLHVNSTGKVSICFRSESQYTPKTNVLAAARARNTILVTVGMDSIRRVVKSKNALGIYMCSLSLLNTIPFSNGVRTNTVAFISAIG